MGRKCSFPGCNSGKISDRTRDKAKGVRMKSLFRFPNRNPDLRKKWEEVLGREAKDYEVVCELHFQEEELQVKYEMALSNGDNFTLERERKALKPNAVPRAEVNDSLNKELAIGPFSIAGNIPTTVIDDEDICSNMEIKIEASDEYESDYSSEMLLAEIKTENQDKENMGLQENITNGIRNSQRSHLRDILCIKTDHEEIPDRNVRNSFKISNAEVPGSNTKSTLTLRDLNRELHKAILPDGWAPTLLRNSLLIGHYNNAPARKEFLIHPDGTVQVFIDKVIVPVSGINSGIRLENVLGNIQILQPLLLCDGVGMKDRCCENCERYVQPTHSYARFGHVRCAPCRRTRRRILKVESRRAELASRLLSKRKEFRRNMENSRRKIRRLQNLKKRQMSTKAKQKRLSIEEQLEVIEKLANGELEIELAVKYGVHQSSISRIKKRKEHILAAKQKLDAMSVDDGARKRYVNSEWTELDKALFEWFKEMKALGTHLTGQIIQDKALVLNRLLNGPAQFKASEGWVDSWKKKCGIHQYQEPLCIFIKDEAEDKIYADEGEDKIYADEAEDKIYADEALEEDASLQLLGT